MKRPDAKAILDEAANRITHALLDRFMVSQSTANPDPAAWEQFMRGFRYTIRAHDVAMEHLDGLALNADGDLVLPE